MSAPASRRLDILEPPLTGRLLHVEPAGSEQKIERIESRVVTIVAPFGTSVAEGLE